MTVIKPFSLKSYAKLRLSIRLRRLRPEIAFAQFNLGNGITTISILQIVILGSAGTSRGFFVFIHLVFVIPANAGIQLKSSFHLYFSKKYRCFAYVVASRNYLTGPRVVAPGDDIGESFTSLSSQGLQCI